MSETNSHKANRLTDHERIRVCKTLVYLSDTLASPLEFDDLVARVRHDVGVTITPSNLRSFLKLAKTLDERFEPTRVSATAIATDDDRAKLNGELVANLVPRVRDLELEIGKLKARGDAFAARLNEAYEEIRRVTFAADGTRKIADQAAVKADAAAGLTDRVYKLENYLADLTGDFKVPTDKAPAADDRETQPLFEEG